MRFEHDANVLKGEFSLRLSRKREIFDPKCGETTHFSVTSHLKVGPKNHTTNVVHDFDIQSPMNAQKGTRMSSAPAEAAPEVSISEMITHIRSGRRQSLGDLLQIYRNYLNILATTQLDARLRRRMSTSDLVQETMLAAHRDFDQFRGGSEGELLAWLRQILSHHLSHAIERNVYAKKRDIRREVSLDKVAKRIDDSIAGLSNLIPDPAATPSEIVCRRELAAELADQLAKLKPSYHDVIVYRNLQACSFDEIATKMDIKPGAARMLWLRAIAKFKEVCDVNMAGDLS